MGKRFYVVCVYEREREKTCHCAISSQLPWIIKCTKIRIMQLWGTLVLVLVAVAVVVVITIIILENDCRDRVKFWGVNYRCLSRDSRMSRIILEFSSRDVHLVGYGFTVGSSNI